MEVVTRVPTLEEPRMVEAFTYGPMGAAMKEIGLKIKSQGRASTSGLMAEYMSVNGSIIICMAQVSTLGKTVECTKATISTIKNMASVFTHGQMVANTTECGKMESRMEKGNIFYRQECKDAVSGEMVLERNGLTLQLNYRLLEQLRHQTRQDKEVRPKNNNKLNKTKVKSDILVYKKFSNL